MASFSLANLMILLAMVHASAASSASIEENANILLEIKAFLIDPSGSLESWAQEKAPSLCTDWYGVTCDNATHTLVLSIDLSNKNLSGTLSPAIGSLTSLQALNLSGNTVTGAVPAEIAACASLRVVDLSNNNFTGELPMGLSKLAHLETLSLWTNSLIGPIPDDIMLCSALTHLDLGGSYLEGEIPYAIGNLTNLVYLTLAGNELTGEIPASLKQLRKLEWLYIGYNQLTGSIPFEVGEITSLKHLDLVHNNLTGELPLSLTNLTSLEYLFLYDNQLSGAIPPAIANLSKLLSLDLSSNLMSGSIPSGISHLTQLQILNLFSNRFTGDIPHALADMHSLQVLALWMNNLTGEVPVNLGLQNNLTVLDLSSNQLSGPIPEHLCASKRLRNLILFSNSMSGPIPQSLANCRSLERVRLEANSFTGAFPQALASLPLVYYLDLSANNFSGRLDGFTWDMPSLQVLHLQGNQFNGSIPPSIENSRGLVTLDLSKNTFTGGIPTELGSLNQLNKLYLNDNMLSGAIQSAGFLKCKQLNDINLSDNRLVGPIPSAIVSLSLLSTLDLSHNQLSGTIPPQLGNMDSLVFVDLSFNRLYGKVPQSGAFIQINASSIEGNPGLCGGSLGPCTIGATDHTLASGSFKARITVVLLLIGLVIAVVGIGNFFWKIKSGDWGGKSIMKMKSMKSKAWGEWNLQLFQAVKPSVEQVLEAMQEENVVEKKSPCIVYKGKTNAGVPFAAMEMIKDYDKSSERGDLGDVLSAIGRSRHPNIVNVYGICCGTTSSIMLFELVEGCTRLSSLLENGCHAGVAFNWERRLYVAVEIAKATLHLQSSCSPPILHGSICSYNVVVDPAFVVRLLPPNTSKACVVNVGNAQKDVEANWFASDIQAFGELLLELMVGRKNGNGTLLYSELQQEWSEHVQCPCAVAAPITAMADTESSRGMAGYGPAGAMMSTIACDRRHGGAGIADTHARAISGTAAEQQSMGCRGTAVWNDGSEGATIKPIGGEHGRSSEAGGVLRRGAGEASGAGVAGQQDMVGGASSIGTGAAGVPRRGAGEGSGAGAAGWQDMVGGGSWTGTERRGGTGAAGVRLAAEICRDPTQARVRQVVRVLEGWRRCQGGGSGDPRTL